MERGISVDNSAGNVVIGDNNVVGAAAWPPVRSAYRKRVLINAPSQLVDREEELAELAAFCLAGRGYAWWRADAWAGKTALMAWFALHPPQGVRVVPFFVTARWSFQSDAEAYVDVVLEQLAELAGQALPAMLTPATREAHLLDLYSLAAQVCSERGERLVLLVDGLDEDRGVTTGSEAHSIAALLPYDIPVVVSGRLNPPLPPDVPEDHPLQDPGIVRVLAPSSAARAIRSEAERELKGLLMAGGLPRDLLGLLTAAGGGLTADDLAELTGEGQYQVRDLLRTRTGRTFARVGEAYLLAHEELQSLAVEMIGPRGVARYRDVVHVWAERWGSRHWPEETPAYLLRGWFSLLRDTGDLGRMRRCALDAARHDRLLAVTGGDRAALTEIEATEAALIDGGVPDFLDFLRLVVAREELVNTSDNIPPTLPWAWAKLGRYDRAEGLARSIVLDEWRALALVDVAKELHRVGRRSDAGALLSAAQEAAEQADDTFGSERDWALQAVSRGWIRVGFHDKAVECARLVEAPWLRAELLCEVSRAWTASGERDHALYRTEEDTVARVLLLATAAVGHAERGDVDEALRLAGEAGPGEEALPLAHIASALLRAGDERAAGILDRMEAALCASPVLPGVVEALAKAGEHGRAMTAAERFDEPESRDWAVCDVVAALMAAGQVDRAQALAESIQDPGARASALCEVVAGRAVRSAADEADGLSTAVELARSLDEPAERDRALRAVVEALAEAGDFDRAEALARAQAPYPTLSREPLGVVVEALARSGDLSRARGIAPDVPLGNGRFALVRGVVTACSDGAGSPEAAAVAAEVVADAERQARSESCAGHLDFFHTALSLAKGGFDDLARDLLRGFEGRGGLARASGEGENDSIGWQIHAASTIETLVRLGEFDRAHTLIRRLGGGPATYRAVLQSMQYLCGEGLFTQAEALAAALEAQAGEGLWEILAKGVAEHGDAASAEPYARRVTTAHGRVDAWTAIAVAHTKAGEEERARVCLDEGLSHYEQTPYAFMSIPGVLRAFFALGEWDAGDALLADVVSRTKNTSDWAASVLLTETVRALVAEDEYDRARAFLRSLPDDAGTLLVRITMVLALAEAGERDRATAEIQAKGLLADAEDADRMPFGLGRLVRVVNPSDGRVLLARLLRRHSLEDLLDDVLYLEPAAAPFAFEWCTAKATNRA
ncbi:hypothetical protein [Streptomyces filamentosus]|uniref:hypothetical protein n=1 Tax=Streptomyces filamentosus TaxID=67294 RepID=UPI0037D53F1A